MSEINKMTKLIKNNELNKELFEIVFTYSIEIEGK